ncbi:MAG: hypothetical protein KF799_08890 [Bdellovibrionales bacterium]|nr:hypothetical protein [Bdellovibrionales bacterium]
MLIWLLTFSLNTYAATAGSLKTTLPTVQVLKRAVVEDRLENLPSVLMEARLESRLPAGYEFTDIDKGSIYDVLGFKVGDILMEINGEKVDSSLKAAQLIVALKTETRFNVKIKRGTKVSSLAYRIED